MKLACKCGSTSFSHYITGGYKCNNCGTPYTKLIFDIHGRVMPVNEARDSVNTNSSKYIEFNWVVYPNKNTHRRREASE
jgi:hypothetical protein